MADAFADWYTHTVDVDTLGPADDWGKRPITTHTDVPCWIEDKVQMIRNQDGVESVSTSIVHLPLSSKDWFTAGSVVKRNGHSSVILQVAVSDSTTGDELDGVEVMLA